MALYISGIDYESFADAEGVSCVLFFSGCLHDCVNCHSPETHDFKYGQKITKELIDSINEEIDKRPFLNSLTLSGGDPMYSAKEILEILPLLHIPNNNLWCFSGFTFEEIQEDKHMNELLKQCSVLVDGLFDHSKRDVSLKFRGSSNQRIINVDESIQQDRVILLY